MARLKSLWLRARLWARGECKHEGCPLPRMGYFDFCEKHAAQSWREACERIAAEKFERDVQVQAETLRRVLPEALAAPSDTEGGQG